MKEKKPACYHIKRIYLEETTLEKIIFHILYRSFLTEKQKNE